MKKLLSLLLILCMLCTIFPGFTAFADVTTELVDEITYSYDEETCTLTLTGNGDMDNYSWWNKFYPPWIGYQEEAKKVIISSGITSIGDYAFEDFTALKEVEIAETVTRLGMHSFSGSTLSEIDIHKNIRDISYMAFVNCDYMVSYNVSEENEYYCSVDGVLFNKDMSVLKVYPIGKIEETGSYTIPDEVVDVEGYAFSRANNLGSVVFGENVKSIGDECFFNCEALSNVTFNDKLEFIGGGAFQHCNLIEEFDLPSTIKKIRPLAFFETGYYIDFSNWQNNLLYIDEYLITGEYCILTDEWRVEEDSYVEGNVTIKEGTTLIAGNAFSWFNWEPAVTSVDFPASLKYISEYAFSYCEAITSINLGSMVEWIDEGAFYGCTLLADIKLGENIKKIGADAFKDTDFAKSSVNYQNGLLYKNNYLLGYENNLPNDIVIRDGTVLIADSALSNGGTYSYNNHTVSFPESLKYIGTEAFINTRINNIEIPDTVTDIGDYALGYKKVYDNIIEEYVYSKLSDAVISGYKDTVAEAYAEKFDIEFVDLTAQTEIEFDYFTATIENNKLTITKITNNSTSLTSIEIPAVYNGMPITKIAANALNSGSGITKIIIPSTVTTIEQNAFTNCYNVVFAVTCSSVAHQYTKLSGFDMEVKHVFPIENDGIENICSGCFKTQCELEGHIINGNSCLRDGCTYGGTGGNVDIGGGDQGEGGDYPDIPPAVSDGWILIDNTYYYYQNNVKVTGWIFIENNWYYFNSNGAMQTGWLFINNNYYYLNADGSMVTGLTIINNNTYFFNTDGTMFTGWKIVNNAWYYFNSNGTMHTNWLNLNGTWYYLNANGSMATGWLNLSGTWYYLNTNGAMQTGWKLISNTWYYFNNGGSMATGLIKIGNTSYYFEASGAMATGWKLLSNKWYYFNNGGAMVTGLTKLGNTTYFFDSNGVMGTGWKQVSGNWYYLNNGGAMQTGWLKISNTWYYLNTNGAMSTGWKMIGSSWYYFNTSGSMATGWLKLGSTWYYLNTGGNMQTGWKLINNTWYYFNASGAWVA